MAGNDPLDLHDREFVGGILVIENGFLQFRAGGVRVLDARRRHIVHEGRAGDFRRQVDAREVAADDAELGRALHRGSAGRRPRQVDLLVERPVIEAGGHAVPQHRTVPDRKLGARAIEHARAVRLEGRRGDT